MPAARYQKRERAALEAGFLNALLRGRTVKAAAEEMGVDRTLLYHWRKADESFARRWNLAQQTASTIPNDPLEAEAERRAVHGIEKPVYRGGSLVGHTREYSDTMLMFLLKARYPEKYDRKGSDKESAEDTFCAQIEGAKDTLKRKLLKDPEQS